MRLSIFRICQIPLCQSLILHGGLLSLFLFGFNYQNPVSEPQAEPDVVQAMVLDETKLQAEVDRLRNQEDRQRLAEANRQKQLENRRQEEERRLLEAKKQRNLEKKRARAEEKNRQALKAKEMKQLAELQNQRDTEIKRLVEIKKQREENEKKRLKEEARSKQAEEKRIAEEKRLAELEEKRKAALERRKQEESLRKQKQAELALKKQREAKQNADDLLKLKKAIADARVLIRQRVKQNWIQPTLPTSGLSCKIRVKLIPGGEVIDARVIQSSGASVFDRSAKTAVLKASPLPVPTDPSLFSRFRTFEFIFKPQ